jgi:hypothetical protein
MSHDGGGGHSGGGHSGGHGGGGHHGHHGGSSGHHHHSQDGWFSLGYQQRSGRPAALVVRMVYFMFVFALAFVGVTYLFVH